MVLRAGLLAAGACASPGPEPLMPTPVLYEDGVFDPFAHLDPRQRSPELEVFYATTRAPARSGSEVPYGNGTSDVLRLGTATVRFGDGLTWEELEAASTSRERTQDILLRLERVEERAILGHDGTGVEGARTGFATELDRRIESGLDPELLVYVHGARVDFYRCTVRTAELLHFMGRDLAGLVFDWPSHQSMLSYAFGGDRARAEDAAGALVTLLEFLATETHARRFHLIGYSAGGETVVEALRRLRVTHAEETRAELLARYRLGTVLFAASDVDMDEFLRDLPALQELAERVVVTASDEDSALVAAHRFMGGDLRIGTESAARRLGAQDQAGELTPLEIVDVSYGKETRGFDIRGHHYWHAHPWVVSEVILSLRLALEADQRGLQPTERERVWCLPVGYPEEARAVLQRELAGAWSRPSQ